MQFEIDFLPVGEGNADAITVCHDNGAGGRTLYLVDGGYPSTAPTIISHIEKYYGPDSVIEHMVLSHADDDHAGGLVDVFKRFPVNNIWMNCPWEFVAEAKEHFHGNFSIEGLIEETRQRHPHLVVLEKEAKKKGLKIWPAFQGTQIGRFRVLAPTRERYLKLLPDFDKTPQNYSKAAAGDSILDRVVEAAKRVVETFGFETLEENPDPTGASNESSVVLIADLNGSNKLLTGDVGPEGLHEAADYGASLGLERPNFMQIPHHGSRRNVIPSVLDRWLGESLGEAIIKEMEAGTRPWKGTAMVSVGTGAGAKRYPRARVKNSFIRRGFQVIATRGGTKSHYKGVSRPGWIAAKREPFSPDVDD